MVIAYGKQFICLWQQPIPKKQAVKLKVLRKYIIYLPNSRHNRFCKFKNESHLQKKSHTILHCRGVMCPNRGRKSTHQEVEFYDLSVVVNWQCVSSCFYKKRQHWGSRVMNGCLKLEGQGLQPVGFTVFWKWCSQSTNRSVLLHPESEHNWVVPREAPFSNASWWRFRGNIKVGGTKRPPADM